MMLIHHHDLIVELPDEWWVEAGMNAFTPEAQAYPVNETALVLRLPDCDSRYRARAAQSGYPDLQGERTTHSP